MALFTPQQNTVELNFNNEYIYHLELSEDVARRIEKAGKIIADVNPRTLDEINAAYNKAMDVIDMVLDDEEASEKIMSLWEHPGTVEVLSVIHFILKEWEKEYRIVLGNMKSTAQMPGAPATHNKPKGKKGGRK